MLNQNEWFCICRAFLMALQLLFTPLAFVLYANKSNKIELIRKVDKMKFHTTRRGVCELFELFSYLFLYLKYSKQLYNHDSALMPLHMWSVFAPFHRNKIECIYGERQIKQTTKIELLSGDKLRQLTYMRMLSTAGASNRQRKYFIRTYKYVSISVPT